MRNNTRGFAKNGIFIFFLVPLLSIYQVSAQCPGDCGTTITPLSNLNAGLTITTKVCFDASSGNIVYTGGINLRPGGHIYICGGTTNTVTLAGNFTEGLNGARNITVDGNLIYDDTDGTANLTKTTITVNGTMTFEGVGTPTIAGITGGSLTVNPGGLVTINAATVNLAATYSIDGTLTVNGNLTTSASSNFSNTGTVNVTGDAAFSGIYNNHGTWDIGQKLSLSASSGSNLTGGIFYCYDLELNSTTLIADAGGCASFVVDNFSDINSAGVTATYGQIGILDLSNPGSIDDVNATCAGTDPAPWTGGPYCGIIPISSIGSGTGCFAVLPVVWMNYSAKQINDHEVKIEWQTSSEHSNSFFTVQRSKDGVNFDNLEKITAAGNSSKITSYSYIDDISFNGLVFYRIQQSDFDGKTSYSDIIVVSMTAEKGFKFDVFPNPAPADEEISLNVAGIEDNSEVVVVLMDNLGTTIYTKVYVTQHGNVLLGVGKDFHLPQGIYYVTASSHQSIVTQKLVVR